MKSEYYSVSVNTPAHDRQARYARPGGLKPEFVNDTMIEKFEM